MNKSTNKMFSDNYPNSLFDYFNNEQKEGLLRLLNIKSLKENSINNCISKDLFPLKGLFTKKSSYKELLIKVSEKHEIDLNQSKTIFEIEEVILKYKFKKIWDELPEGDKEKIKIEMLKVAELNGLDKDQLNAIKALTTIGLANLSGFGVYLMATTFVGLITSFFGITLPFAFYTGMTYFISVVIGPVGWVIGGSFLVYKLKGETINSLKEKSKNTALSLYNNISDFFKGNGELSIILITYISSCRIMIKNDNEKQVKELTKKIEVYKNETKIKDKRINALKLETINIQNDISNLDKKIVDKQTIINQAKSILSKLN